MPNLEVRGRCHPPPHKDPKYKGWELWASEVDRVMPKYVGKPVYVNHDPSEAVGKVKKVYRDKNSGSIVVDLALDPTDKGLRAMKDVHGGKLRGLSLGYDAYENPVTKGRIGEAIPKEISLCEVGAMPDTLIYAFQVDDVVAVSSQKAKSIYTSNRISLQNSLRNMSAEQEATQASATAAADHPSGGSQEDIARWVALGKEAEAKRVGELRDLVLKAFIPAYNQIISENPDAGIAGLPEALDELMGTTAGQVMLKASGLLGGNYLQREKAYAAKDEEVKKLMEERQKIEASKTALVSEDERKVDMFKFAPLISVANSGSAPEQSAKRVRFADAFTPSNKALADARAEIKNGIVRGEFAVAPTPKN